MSRELPGFEGLPAYSLDPAAEKVSRQGRRRPDYRTRALASFERGRHWITGEALRPEVTCGSCGRLVQVQGGRRRYWKCALRRTASARTDVRRYWPGCILWQPKGARDG